MIGSMREEQRMICPLLLSVFEDLERADISYCLLRGYEELLEGIIDGDVDLLVAPDRFDQMRRLLEQLGFVALSRWGQAPHHFFIGYDEAGDRWLKLDVMTELTYGRPVPVLRTGLAPHCLDTRVRRGPAFVPAAEDEFLSLLLHCLLDKGAVEPAYAARLVVLAQQIGDDPAMADLVGRCFPASVSWQRLKRLVAGAEWDALLRLRPLVADYLARHDSTGTRWRRTTARLLRFADRRTRTFRGQGLTVALLAPDGAGKTTLARSLGRAFYLPTRYIYMGANPNGGGITLPTTRWLARKTVRRRPVMRALSALNTLIEQGVRYRVGAYHRRRGRLVIFDRYAAKSLSVGRSNVALRKRVRRWASQLLCPPPDMVVYLDAPAEVLYLRKQEHSPQALEQQRQRYLRILDGVGRTVVVDARRAPEELRRHVSGLIWRRYAVNMKRREER